MSCVFFTTIHFKEALYSSPVAALDIQNGKLLRSHFLETFCNAQKVLREIGLNSALCKAGQSTHCAKKSRQKVAHTGRVSVGEHKAEREGAV